MVRAYAATYGQVNFYCRDPRHTHGRDYGRLVQLADFVDLADRVGPILVFLVAITVVAELADGIGLFAIVARWAAVLGRGSVLGLWLLVVLVATVATAVLSLDTTAVLLTPVVLVLARRLGLGQELFAFTAVWLANTASLILPVSNLTNLLAYARLRPAGVAFTPLMWAPALAVWLVTVVLLGVVFRRRLRGRYEVPTPFPVDDRGLLIVAGVVCAGLGPAFVLGADVTVAAVIGALVLVIACLVRRPRLVGWRLLPWPLVLGVSVLFVLVEIAHAYGLVHPGERAGRSGGRLGSTCCAWPGCPPLAANLLNNLPAYLAVEPSALDSPVRLAALLVGVNAGPLITPWASLATLLWAGRCRAAGLQVSWLRFAGLGAVLVPLCLLAGTGALVLGWLTDAQPVRSEGGQPVDHSVVVGQLSAIGKRRRPLVGRPSSGRPLLVVGPARNLGTARAARPGWIRPVPASRRDRSGWPCRAARCRPDRCPGAGPGRW